jgi:hypothetical protein
VDILPDLIKVLSEIGFLTDHLSMPHEVKKNEKTRIKKVEKKENEKILKNEKNEKKLQKDNELYEENESDIKNTESIGEEDTGESGRLVI